MKVTQTLPSTELSVQDSTASRMGSPVPAGWVEPSPWPVLHYRALRPAVLFIYRETCLRCQQPSTCCTLIDRTGPRGPENLLVFCYACIGARLQWTTEEIAEYRHLALENAPMIRRMTGWGLSRQKSTPKRPKRRVKKTSGRPPKSDERKRTILVSYRLSPAEHAKIVGSDPDFDLNGYARGRLLMHRNVHAPHKKRLNDAGTRLKALRHELEEALHPYHTAQPDHPLVAVFRTRIAELGDIGDALISIYLDL